MTASPGARLPIRVETPRFERRHRVAPAPADVQRDDQVQPARRGRREVADSSRLAVLAQLGHVPPAPVGHDGRRQHDVHGAPERHAGARRGVDATDQPAPVGEGGQDAYDARLAVGAGVPVALEREPFAQTDALAVDEELDARRRAGGGQPDRQPFAARHVPGAVRRQDQRRSGRLPVGDGADEHRGGHAQADPPNGRDGGCRGVGHGRSSGRVSLAVITMRVAPKADVKSSRDGRARGTDDAKWSLQRRDIVRRHQDARPRERRHVVVQVCRARGTDDVGEFVMVREVQPPFAFTFSPQTGIAATASSSRPSGTRPSMPSLSIPRRARTVRAGAESTTLPVSASTRSASPATLATPAPNRSARGLR